jgi:hypothetical protein
MVWGLNAKTPTEWGFTQVGVRGLKDEVLSYPLSCSGLHPFVFLQEAETPCVTPFVFTSSGSDGRCSTCYNPVLIPPGTLPNEAKQMIKDYLETGKTPELPFD